MVLRTMNYTAFRHPLRCFQVTNSCVGILRCRRSQDAKTDDSILQRFVVGPQSNIQSLRFDSVPSIAIAICHDRVLTSKLNRRYHKLQKGSCNHVLVSFYHAFAPAMHSKCWIFFLGGFFFPSNLGENPCSAQRLFWSMCACVLIMWDMSRPRSNLQQNKGENDAFPPLRITIPLELFDSKELSEIQSVVSGLQWRQLETSR